MKAFEEVTHFIVPLVKLPPFLVSDVRGSRRPRLEKFTVLTKS